MAVRLLRFSGFSYEQGIHRVRAKIREAGLGAVFTAALGERHIFLEDDERG